MVDPIIPNMNFQAFQQPFLPASTDQQQQQQLDTSCQTAAESSDGDDKKADSKSETSLDSGIEAIHAEGVQNSPPPGEQEEPEGDAGSSGGREAYVVVTLDQQDKNTGALHVWFLVLEGLASTVAACPKNYQPQTLDTLFSLMRSAAHVPGKLAVSGWMAGHFVFLCVYYLA